MTTPYHTPQHKQPETLREAIDADQKRRDEAYAEYRKNVERYQREQESKK